MAAPELQALTARFASCHATHACPRAGNVMRSFSVHPYVSAECVCAGAVPTVGSHEPTQDDPPPTLQSRSSHGWGSLPNPKYLQPTAKRGCPSPTRGAHELIPPSSMHLRGMHSSHNPILCHGSTLLTAHASPNLVSAVAEPVRFHFKAEVLGFLWCRDSESYASVPVNPQSLA